MKIYLFHFHVIIQFILAFRQISCLFGLSEVSSILSDDEVGGQNRTTEDRTIQTRYLPEGQNKHYILFPYAFGRLKTDHKSHLYCVLSIVQWHYFFQSSRMNRQHTQILYLFFRQQKNARINVFIAHQFRQFKTVLKNEDAAISNIRIIGRQSVSCPISFTGRRQK